MTLLSGWGRNVTSSAEVTFPDSVEVVQRTVRASRQRGALPRGLGRNYGDAANNGGGLVLDCTAFQQIGDIDPDGLVSVGAGVSIGSLIDRALPQGWFVPVTPGTRHVTLGGAVAADIHGKNHHRDGSLGDHVVGLEVVDGRGDLRTLSRDNELFRAVLGGLGLAGIITAVRLQMRRVESAGIVVRTVRTQHLDDTLNALQDADERDLYSVAWLDTLSEGGNAGRGVVTSGGHASAGAPGGVALADHDVPRAAPTPPWVPSGLLRPATVRGFNEAWYRMAGRAPAEAIQGITTFFHPLDRVQAWNRLYGSRGFLQYQFAVADADTIVTVLSHFRAAKAPGLLAVLKRFGPAQGAPLSFPIAGWTLAVDFPANASLGVVLDRADDMVAEAGGRIYLVKDARMRPELVPVMYPEITRWRELRSQLDPEGVFMSDLSRRLRLC